MKKEVGDWIQYAQRDYEDAQTLIEHNRVHGGLLCIHQATEKIIKALLLSCGRETVPMSHDLRYLLDLISDAKSPLDQDQLRELSLVYTRIRYPDMSATHYANAQKVRELIRQFEILYLWTTQECNKH